MESNDRGTASGGGAASIAGGTGPAARPDRRILGIGELGRRLIVIFVSLVIATLLADVVVGSLTVTGDIGTFVANQESYVASSAALGAGSAFGRGHFDPAALTPVVQSVALAGGGVTVLDGAGRRLVQSPGFAAMPASSQLSRPVVVGGVRTGEVQVRFGPAGVRADAARLNAQRWRARILAFVVALALALVVSVLVAQRITRPLERLLAALRARGAGNRQARVTDLRAVGVLREILQAYNVATDALDQRDRAQRELVGNVAHELRTPVAVLQAGTEAMLDGVTEPSQANLDSLHEEVIRLSARLDDLLTLARASSATLHLSLEPHDLARLAAGAAARLGDLCEASGVELTLQLGPAPTVKYSPGGGTITVETGQAGISQVYLRISDTGIGIEPADLPRVTERFFRGANSAAVAAGSGIGLTVVDELVRAQEGVLEIASQSGAGTRVTITFPAA